jgi:hypothetical protein
MDCRGARWPCGQCARREIEESKQRSQRSVIRWVTKIYYRELLRASKGSLSCWSRLRLQSLAPTPVSIRVYIRPVVKVIAESLSQHDEKHVVTTPLSVGKSVGRRRCHCCTK